MNKPLSDKEFKQRLSAKLKALRKDLGETQMEFAKRCGISQPAVSAHEKGRMVPGVRPLLRILNATGTDVGMFFADLFKGE